MFLRNLVLAVLLSASVYPLISAASEDTFDIATIRRNLAAPIPVPVPRPSNVIALADIVPDDHLIIEETDGLIVENAGHAVAVNEAGERIYNGTLPNERFTFSMPGFFDGNGKAECVQLLKSLMAAPRTIFWREGRRLQDTFHSVVPGTAIATFKDGQYPQQGRSGKHAAIFLRATDAGIWVLDQFRNRPTVKERFIPWYNPRDKNPSNNARNYSTVRW